MTRLSATNTSIYIAQGEQAIGDREDHIISTILGSCVAVCLWDRVRKIGGMNHILLPDRAGSDILTLSVGAGAMEGLINALLKAGAMKSDFEAKVFGGAAVVAGLSDIGERNGEFVMGYLETERIPVISKSLGGTQARRLRFWPAAGRASQKLVVSSEAPPVETKAASANDLELF
ncbi:MAG: chemotaxis protein CheD [Pseudomonadota bacterium]